MLRDPLCVTQGRLSQGHIETCNLKILHRSAYLLCVFMQTMVAAWWLRHPLQPAENSWSEVAHTIKHIMGTLAGLHRRAFTRHSCLCGVLERNIDTTELHLQWETKHQQGKKVTWNSLVLCPATSSVRAKIRTLQWHIWLTDTYCHLSI